jgi:uncharacterized protein YecE (DUF72 family)
LERHTLQVARWRIGCAGWSIPAAHAARFPAHGSHLERYAQVFDAVEINSSFYRPHRPSTYARWADAVPPDFRFAVKMPKTLSHEARLRGGEAELAAFLDQAGRLGAKLGCLLLQLPPSLAFEPGVAEAFFRRLRASHPGPVACEPRHPTWFAAPADALLRAFGIARAGADPARRPRAALPAGDRRIEYLRLHGSPHTYYDAYGEAALARVARRLRTPRPGVEERWCVFDNTALGHATANALALAAMLRHADAPRRS